MTEKTANDYEAGARRHALGFVTYICEDGTIYIFDRGYSNPRAFTNAAEALAWGKTLQGRTYMQIINRDKRLEEARQPTKNLLDIQINI